jgi:hypothetical protein
MLNDFDDILLQDVRNTNNNRSGSVIPFKYEQEIKKLECK